MPESSLPLIRGLRLFFVEEEKPARHFLKKLNPAVPVNEYQLRPLNEHTAGAQVSEYVQLLQGQSAGLISAAGCPCVADPGADLVLLAQQNGIEIVPLAGPSSIILALMASGLNGQNFAFNGYLPRERGARNAKITELEKRSAQEGQTQIFMETPYRNESLLAQLLETCHPATLLCVAVDLTCPGQWIRTAAVAEWRKTKAPDLDKRPAMFLLYKPGNSGRSRK